MKQLIYIIICSVFCSNIAFAESVCGERAGNIADEYFKTNESRQIRSKEFESLSTEKQKEARIRNLCFGASIDWVYFCELGNCYNAPDTEKNSDGITKAQYCTWKNIDCFSEDIEKIFSVMQDSNDSLYKLFFSDMNAVNQSIIKDEETLFQIDADNSRCYRTDDYGNTVWHAFAQNGKLDWDSTCVSYLRDTHLQELSDAMYKTKNKDGKTALQQTLEWDKETNLLSALSEVYGETGGRKACDKLASDISTTNGIDISQVKPLINRCYIFADRK